MIESLGSDIPIYAFEPTFCTHSQQLAQTVEEGRSRRTVVYDGPLSGSMLARIKTWTPMVVPHGRRVPFDMYDRKYDMTSSEFSCRIHVLRACKTS